MVFVADRLLLTFIVPCYNVEKYIQRCLDSIYSCGLPEGEFEVLCIDDCSPDGTAGVLEKNKCAHSNLRVIHHQSNRGLGGGRNTGVREAKGRYLWFVDSDDMIIGDGFPYALDRAVTENLDVLCFNYCRINEEGKELSRHHVFGDTVVDNGYGFVMKTFSENLVNHIGYVWRFFYRTEFLRCHNLYFPEQVRWEDTVFMPKSILLAERIAAISQVFYAYRVNPDSISGVFGKAYPAKSIYEFAFFAGGDLLRFSDEVEGEELKTAFRNAAVNKYINGFAIHLFRTNKKERKRFFKIVSAHKHDLEPLRKQMTLLNRLLLAFPLAADCGSMVYKITHK